MSDPAVLHPQTRLNLAEVNQLLEKLPEVFDHVADLSVEETAFLELPDDQLPEPSLFESCLTDFSVTGYLDRVADVRAELARVLKHDFRAVQDILGIEVELRLEVEDDDTDGIEALGLRREGDQTDFEIRVVGPASPDACAKVYEQVIHAARLPLRFAASRDFVLEHSEGRTLRTSGMRSGFPPGSVHCPLAPEPAEASLERLFGAHAALGVELHRASWHASVRARPGPERVVEAYRALHEARFSAHHFRGDASVVPNIPHGITAIGALEPMEGETRDRIAAEVRLGSNTITVIVRAGAASGHDVILVGTHALDRSWLERELGVAWTPLTPSGG